MALINPEIAIIGREAVGRLGRLPEHSGRPRQGAARKIRLPSGATTEMANVSRSRPPNFMARVIQHETDHLDGVLFFDRMKSFETLTFLEEFQRYPTRRRDVPEE